VRGKIKYITISRKREKEGVLHEFYRSNGAMVDWVESAQGWAQDNVWQQRLLEFS
jgi:hypothetical protein